MPKLAVADPKPSQTPDAPAEILRGRRRLKMTRSAQTYVRGSTAQFYAWLQASA